MARKPMRAPIQKFSRKANFTGKPYSPHLRCSILPITSAAIAVRKKINASVRPVPAGVSDEEPMRPGPILRKWIASAIARAATATRPLMIAKKISARQPARMPFGPRKTGSAATGGGDGGVGGISGTDMQLIYAKTCGLAPG